MRKHTPGPWVVYNDSDDGKTNRIEIAARGKTVARIYHSVPDEVFSLIAAAPDLLEVLQQIVGFWDEIVPTDCVNEMHIKARAAIAKATGEHHE
jgi:hypothetical protein